MESVSISSRCAQAYPGMRFAYGCVSGIVAKRTCPRLVESQREAEAYVKCNVEMLMERAKKISAFYKIQGEKNRSHIESQIKAVVKAKSMRPINCIVDSVVISEMRNAIPLGVHDLDKLIGNVVLDAANEGERFAGIGGREVVTRQNELVLRDDVGIWASYTQGPDERTIVAEATRNVMILGFFVPGIPDSVVVRGIEEAAAMLATVAGGGAAEVRIAPS
jgi:DNA/RNA-binding domain of Phe-tRNA-synthetase-like protein